MNEILNVPDDLKSEVQLISESSDSDWLICQLQQSLSVTVQQVIKAAAIVRRLEECDVEINVRPGILSYLRRVSYGQILPELVANLHADPSLLQRACSLSIPEQRIMADDEQVQVMSPDGDHRMVKPSAMSKREVRQVFGKMGIRTDSEQISWIMDEQIKAKAKTHSGPEVLIDKKRSGIVVAGVFVSSRDLARYLGELSPGKTERLRSA